MVSGSGQRVVHLQVQALLSLRRTCTTDSTSSMSSAGGAIDPLQRQPVGLDLRQVQDVADQLQQGFPVPLNSREELVAVPGEGRLGDASRSVKPTMPYGRADLVAHVGQKLALGPAGLFGGDLAQTNSRSARFCSVVSTTIAPTAVGLPSAPAIGKNDSSQCRWMPGWSGVSPVTSTFRTGSPVVSTFLENWLDRRREPGHDFPNSSANMLFDRNSIHLGQRVVNMEIPVWVKSEAGRYSRKKRAAWARRRPQPWLRLKS